MNIIKRELRANLKAFIIWTISLTFVLYASSAEFGVFKDSPEIIEAMTQFDDMLRAIGGSIANMLTPEGYLSLMSIYLYLPASIYGALLGSSIISKEEKDKTAEYLFTLPIKRNQVLTRKIIAAVIYQILFVGYIISACIVIFSRFGLTDDFYTFMMYLFVALSFTSLIFMSIGMMFSAVLKEYKRSGSLTLAILISTYMLNMLVNVIEDLDFMRYFIPFQYFAVDEMLNSNIELVFVLIATGIITACISSVFIFYRKRDLYI